MRKGSSLSWPMMSVSVMALIATTPVVAQVVPVPPANQPVPSASAPSSSAQSVPAPLADGSAPDAQAPPEAAEGGASLGDIVVTARRREESAQRVPISITAFAPEALARADIRNLQDLTKNTPGVNLCCSVANPAFIFVRGVGNGTPTYFADVPQANAGGFANFIDIQNVQVLKGPQGTLFGQASNAGAFVYEPRKPSDKLEGYVAGTIGSLNRRSLEGAVNVPLFDGRLLVRVAATSFSRDGYQLDLSNGRRYGNQDYYVVRPSVLVKITDTLSNYTMLQHSHLKSTDARYVADFNFQPTALLPGLNTQATVNGGSRAALDALRAQVLAQQRALGPYRIAGLSTGCASPSGPIFGPATVTGLGYTEAACAGDRRTDNLLVNTTTWEVSDDWSIRNIFGYNWGSALNQPADVDATQLIIGDNGSPRNNFPIKANDVYSDEVQLQGSVGIFTLTVGSFNTWRHNTPQIVFTLLNGTQQTASRAKTSGKSNAIYAQSNIDAGSLLPGLTATVGGRYTWDTIRQQSEAINPSTLAVLRVVGGPGSPAGEASFSNFSYTASLQYQVTPRTMLYVTNSRGFSSGGLQNVVGFETFKPDVLTNLEGGVKSTFDIGSMRARVNAAAFYGWFDDVKVTVTALTTNSVTGAIAPVAVVQNAAKALVRGLEGDATLIPVRNVEFGGFFAYTNNKYTSWPSINAATLQPVELSDTPFLQVPRWKWGVRGSYTQELGSGFGDLVFSADFSHRTKIFFQAAPRTPINPANYRSGLVCTRPRTAAFGYPALVADGSTSFVDCREPASNLDASISWNNIMGNESLSGSVTMTNLTKNIQTEGQTAADNSLGYTAFTTAPPRTIYASVRLAF